MHHPLQSDSRHSKLTVILAVTLGNLLEWYEIYLFVYWAPVISNLFFSPGPQYSRLLDTFLVFFLGFLARPLGGIFFGRLGDLIGRRKTLIISVLMMIIPTFLISFLPTYEAIGALSTWGLAFLRVLQSFPAGGEVPGAACYLYESSRSTERIYMTSWTGVGIQTGIIIATVECFVLENILSPKQLLNWGWRVSFFTAGCIGLCGLFLRSKLHETPLFQDLSNHAKVVKGPVLQVIKKHANSIVKSFLYCVLVSPAFYFISINFSSYFNVNITNSYLDQLVLTFIFLLIVTVPLPWIGKLAENYSVKKLLVYSTVILIINLFPLYDSVNNGKFEQFIITSVIFCACIAFITALTPYLLCDLFPTKVRYTGVAIGYNLVDAVAGGITPAATLFLFEKTGIRGSFCWILLFVATISLISFFFIKERANTIREQ